MTGRFPQVRCRVATILLGTVAGCLGTAVFHAVRPPQTECDAGDSTRSRLATDCREMADWVLRTLGDGCHAIVREPLVVAGDVPVGELDERYRRTLRPVVESLAPKWFDTPPDQPVTVLLLADPDRYAEQARSLVGREAISPLGQYRPHLRLVVVNASEGDRPLRHELTHALMDFDFPDAPEWLQEGLASLAETEGQPGPRLATLARAMREGRVGTLRSLVCGDDFREGSAPLQYSHACSLCLYLEHRGLLGTFYRRFRDDHQEDPSGERTLLVLLDADWPEADRDFRRWVAEEGAGFRVQGSGEEKAATDSRENTSSPPPSLRPPTPCFSP